LLELVWLALRVKETKVFLDIAGRGLPDNICLESILRAASTEVP